MSRRWRARLTTSLQRGQAARDVANVYRLGHSGDVHVAPVIGGARRDVLACNIDGGDWRDTKPDGPECAVCFAGLDASADGSGVSDGTRPGTRGRGGWPYTSMGTGASTAAALSIAALAFLGGVIASPDTEPAVTIYASPSPLVSATASGDPLVSLLPTLEPSPSGVPLPTATVGPPFQPVTSPSPVEPEPTRGSVPAPAPTPAPTCTHPGEHHGVDACRWPHN